jgi:hypothetical protein
MYIVLLCFCLKSLHPGWNRNQRPDLKENLCSGTCKAQPELARLRKMQKNVFNNLVTEIEINSNRNYIELCTPQLISFKNRPQIFSSTGGCDDHCATPPGHLYIGTCFVLKKTKEVLFNACTSMAQDGNRSS